VEKRACTGKRQLHAVQGSIDPSLSGTTGRDLERQVAGAEGQQKGKQKKVPFADHLNHLLGNRKRTGAGSAQGEV